ncbi:MAG: cytochrome c peroxidase [Bacteroidota bacterium]
MKLSNDLQLPLALFFVMATLSFSACRQDDDDSVPFSATDQQLENLLASISPDGQAAFRLPESDDFVSIPQDPNNPLTATKVLLGKLLFHETGLAINPMDERGRGEYSCATCHFAQGGFQANRFQGIGEGGVGFLDREASIGYAEDQLDVQPIRTPAALNAAYQDVMLWNGQFGATGTNEGTEAFWTPETPIATNTLGYQGLEIQAIAGLGVHRQAIDQDSLTALNYDGLFEEAFPDWPATDRITTETAGLAIAAYERTILANRSPWQLWLRGQYDRMTEMEKQGAILFFGEAGCVSCHSGPSLASMSFHAVGMDDLDRCPEPTFGTSPDAPANLGRGGFTGQEEDRYRFKTPQLYNLSDSPFYGHGASFFSIREVLEYKNAGISQNDRVPSTALSAEFVPLNLSTEEINELTAFLSQSLRDPDLIRYVPEAVLSGNCIPNNDPGTKMDLNCD